MRFSQQRPGFSTEFNAERKSRVREAAVAAIVPYRFGG
jgi:hypothetical protein